MPVPPAVEGCVAACRVLLECGGAAHGETGGAAAERASSTACAGSPAPSELSAVTLMAGSAARPLTLSAVRCALRRSLTSHTSHAVQRTSLLTRRMRRRGWCAPAPHQRSGSDCRRCCGAATARCGCRRWPCCCCSLPRLSPRSPAVRPGSGPLLPGCRGTISRIGIHRPGADAQPPDPQSVPASQGACYANRCVMKVSVILQQA